MNIKIFYHSERYRKEGRKSVHLVWAQHRLLVVAVRPATTTHRRRQRGAAVAHTARRRQGKRGAQPPMGRYGRQGGVGTMVVVGRRGRCRRYHNFRSFQQQAAVVAVGWGGGYKGGLRAEASEKGEFTGKKKERVSVKHGPNNYKDTKP
jgi:hypothetical protein